MGTLEEDGSVVDLQTGQKLPGRFPGISLKQAIEIVFEPDIYEPERGNPLAAAEDAPSGEYDAGYRASGDFLKWLTDNHGKEIVRKLNNTCRDGRYRDEIRKGWLGKTASELGAEWKQQGEERKIAGKAES